MSASRSGGRSLVDGEADDEEHGGEEGQEADEGAEGERPLLGGWRGGVALEHLEPEGLRGAKDDDSDLDIIVIGPLAVVVFRLQEVEYFEFVMPASLWLAGV